MSQKSYYCTESSQKEENMHEFAQNNGLETPMRKKTSMTQNAIDQQQTMHKYNVMKSQKFQDSMATRPTPRPQRKIVLYDQHKNKHFFPIYKDKDLGIPRQFQEMVIESWNDDDKQTSTTQMERGIQQTLQDLEQVFGELSYGNKKY